MLVRSLMCTAGEVEVSVELTPRPEYGIVTPMMSVIEGGILVRGGADILLLCCPTRLEVADSSATGRLRMQHGQLLAMGLMHRRLRGVRSPLLPEHYVVVAGTISRDRSVRYESLAEAANRIFGPRRPVGQIHVTQTS